MSGADRTGRALELFEEVCELEGDALARRLDEACDGDVELRERVERLLSRDADPASSPFDERSLDGGLARRTLAIPVDETPRLPQSIGRYRVRSLLGAGGMGLVYEAEQPSPRRRVAVKVVHPSLLSEERTRRLRREAEILARMQHPGIAQVIECGVDGEGADARPFFAMEFVEGTGLLEHVVRRSVPRPDRLELFARVCEAVHHAHEQGIVHRDLKPDNILVDREGQPKVLDFGVARAQEAGELTTMRTAEGSVLGTLAYMSPEQAEGSLEEVGRSSDVYSLGAVLFELAVGRPPHDLAGMSLPAALRAVQEAEPARLGTFDSALRGDLDVIAGKALENDPRRRYPTAEALADDVRRHLRSEPIRARSPSALYRASKYARRHRALVVGTLSTLLVMLVGTIVSIDQARRAIDSRRLARTETYVARLEAASSALQAADPQRARASLESLPQQAELDVGWEWRHLWSRVEETSIDLPGAPASGTELALDAGGRWAIARAEQGLLRWEDGGLDQEDRIPLEVRPTCLARTAPRDRLAVGTADGRVLVVDAVVGEVVESFALEGETPIALGWDAGGGRLVAASERSLFVVGGGAVARTVSLAERRFRGLCVLPDGEHVVVTEGRLDGSDGAPPRVALRRIEDGEVVKAFRSSFRRSPSVSPDGARLVLGGSNGLFEALALPAMNGRSRVGGHIGEVGTLRWSTDEPVLLSAGDDGVVLLRDGPRLEHLAALDTRAATSGDGATCSDVARLRSGDVLVALGDRALSWEPRPEGSVPLAWHKKAVSSVCFSEDGSVLVSRDAEQHVVAWDVVERAPLRSFRMEGSIAGLLVGRESVVVFRDRIEVFDLALFDRELGESVDRGERFRAMPAHLDTPRGARVQGAGPARAFSADHRYLARAKSGEVVDLEADRPVLRLDEEGLLGGVTFDPSGERVVFCGARTTVHSLLTAEHLATLEDEEGRIQCAAFDPGGTRLATGGEDGLVCIWQAGSWRLLLTMRGHHGRVKCVAWSPDGTLLASGGNDGTIHLWDSVPSATRRRERAEARRSRAATGARVEELFEESGEDLGATAEALRAELPEAGPSRSAAVLAMLELVERERGSKRGLLDNLLRGR